MFSHSMVATNGGVDNDLMLRFGTSFNNKVFDQKTQYDKIAFNSAKITELQDHMDHLHNLIKSAG